MRFRFAGFVLDAARFELLRDGQPVAVQPKALRLLLHLLENRERTLTKLELLDTLWEGTAVTENSLTRAVTLARAALGETSQNARILRTVHGVGYSLGVEVACEEEATPARDAPARPVPAPANEHFLVQPALAVLPFANETGDPEQAYLAEALAAGSLTALSGWRWFPVISRQASFRFAPPWDDMPAIGRALGARYLVAGSVRRAGDQLRVPVQLVEAASARELWSDRFEGRLADVFDLEDRIADAVAREIEPRLDRAETRRVLRKRPENLDAWDCVVRAQWHVHRAGPDDFREAHALLDRALHLDPGSSFAWSIRALCRFGEILQGWSGVDAIPSFRATLEAARRAVELDDDDWLAHALLGLACLWAHRDYETALREVQQALELNPSGATAYQFLGCVLEFGFEPKDAIRALEASLRLDPRYQSTSLILSDLALCQLRLRDPEEAIALAERAVAESDDNVRARQRLAAALAQAGRVEEARRVGAELLERQPDTRLDRMAPTYPFRDPADLDYLLAGLEKAGIPG